MVPRAECHNRNCCSQRIGCFELRTKTLKQRMARSTITVCPRKLGGWNVERPIEGTCPGAPPERCLEVSFRTGVCVIVMIAACTGVGVTDAGVHSPACTQPCFVRSKNVRVRALLFLGDPFFFMLDLDMFSHRIAVSAPTAPWRTVTAPESGRAPGPLLCPLHLSFASLSFSLTLSRSPLAHRRQSSHSSTPCKST